MKKTTSGFIVPVIIVLIAVLAIGGVVYVSKQEKKNRDTKVEVTFPATSTSTISTTTASGKVKADQTIAVSGNTVEVLDQGTVVQRITLDQDAIEEADFLQSIQDNPERTARFITDLDVNFDGHKDVGVLVGTGYGGVNYFYDFYLYNPSTKRLEKNDQLKSIGNPSTATSAKVVVSSYKDGPRWYTKEYAWDGSKYIVGKDIPNN